jgi:metal iron transporter
MLYSINDPIVRGNWGVDLQAGSQFGYKLLFIVLLAGLFAVFLQVIASRLGCVTGLDLASHCRLLLHDRPRHTKLYRWLALYPLYALSEIAIISTDLAELLGSAIALCMLFPHLPLWAGVLLTGFDVLIILALGDPLRGRPARMFEFLIASLVLAVLICMAIIIAKLNVDWEQAFGGFVPSKLIFAKGGLYTSVGILGATVMPHSLFLGSSLATQDRISPAPPKPERNPLEMDEKSSIGTALQPERRSHTYRALQACIEYVAGAFRVPPRRDTTAQPKNRSERSNNPLPFVRAHLYHGVVDIVTSLLGFAVLINSLILILASAVFFYGTGVPGNANPASLFDAHDLIRDLVGKPAAFLFALALLASGQSSSIIATVAGQAVSEGFLQWRVSPVVRRLLTRALGLIPSMVVAIAVGRPGIDALLVASQVVLSITLPFITLPLLFLTSSPSVMRVGMGAPGPGAPLSPSVAPVDAEQNAPGMVDFSNGKLMVILGSVIWLIILVANVYVIVELGLGQGST